MASILGVTPYVASFVVDTLGLSLLVIIGFRSSCMKQRQPRRTEAPAENGSREQITVGHSIEILKKSETGVKSHESRVRR